MDMLRSPCALIVENAAILLQMITSHKPDCGELVRDSALSSATLLRHFYNAGERAKRSERALMKTSILVMNPMKKCYRHKGN